MSYGLVAKDHYDFVLGGRMGTMEKEMQIEWAELLALEESINFARSKSWSKLEFKTNCVSLVNRFNRRNADLRTLGHHIPDMYKMMKSFCCFNFNWAPKCCNQVADFRCNWAITKNCTMGFNMDYPLDIHDLVLNDAIN
ncbi:hypothetical protein PVK06_011649 [Gossypium arboreum]|uniref:RNase H type-1 domain-containing protein n=1 Tax=Gossypium arboreum TaxID=29729 RepID=A0ABR0Q9J9_GOSAR|nr:hypothetical protein PVK06_011649 [Gossypium arboreum]